MPATTRPGLPSMRRQRRRCGVGAARAGGEGGISAMAEAVGIGSSPGFSPPPGCVGLARRSADPTPGFAAHRTAPPPAGCPAPPEDPCARSLPRRGSPLPSLQPSRSPPSPRKAMLPNWTEASATTSAHAGAQHDAPPAPQATQQPRQPGRCGSILPSPLRHAGAGQPPSAPGSRTSRAPPPAWTGPKGHTPVPETGSQPSVSPKKRISSGAEARRTPRLPQHRNPETGRSIRYCTKSLPRRRAGAKECCCGQPAEKRQDRGVR